jgi:hypothetical protein
MRTRPLVGVTADRTMMGVHPSHTVGEKYIAAVVEGSQALAMLLPALGNRQATAEILEAVDGLLFTSPAYRARCTMLHATRRRCRSSPQRSTPVCRSSPSVAAFRK